jgi:hypothetical protein
MLTADGVKEILNEVMVHIPFVAGERTAVISENSPNLCSMGRLIIDEGYKIKEWTQEGGLVFLSPDGSRVPVYLDEYVPFFGSCPVQG